MSFVARFEEINGDLFRFDTRIYLGEYDLARESFCVASIVGKNPGSASPKITGELSDLELDGDKLLPFVRNRFLATINMKGRSPEPNTYVRVWNLFYLCNKNLHEAKLAHEKHGASTFCASESHQVPINWFAWGPSDSYLDPYKNRFLSKEYKSPFFYDNRKKFVISGVPVITDSVKHTQGMPARPVENHLALVL